MLFYTGSYTHQDAPAVNPKGKGISCFELDELVGKIRFLSFTEQRNPSYLTISEDRCFLYAIEEMCEAMKPRVYSYKIHETGELHLINSQEIIGDYACHLSIVANQLVIANYSSGNFSSHPICTDGSLEASTQIIQHSGKGPNAERQESAHAHMVCPYKEKQMFVVDLGMDSTLAYKFIESTNVWKKLPTQDIVVPEGSGPRHMVMDPSQERAYILSELSGEVFVLKYCDVKFEVVQQIALLPGGFESNAGGAAIRLHPNGKFLYTSCRGADMISVFRISAEEGTLELIYSYKSGGKTPRDINISPMGNWLISANQDSNDLHVYKLDQKDGSLTDHSSILTGTPVNICWR